MTMKRIVLSSGCCCFVLFAIILTAVLLAKSHVELGPNLYGLRYGGYNNKVYSKIYNKNAKYWLSPEDEFITFPSTAVTIDHTSLECFTSDRVNLDLTLSFQYSIAKNSLVEMLLPARIASQPFSKTVSW